MAFIDRSGDLIVDAVLTDIGREKIARNDGSFRVVGYSFADDEVDYTLFNPNTGSAFVDKEILNLPLFEANTNETLNFNYPLMIVTNPNLKYLPNLTADSVAISIGEEQGLINGVTVRAYQNTTKNARVVPSEIQDSAFTIEVDNDLLNVQDESPIDISSYGTSVYLLPRDSQLVQSSQGSQVTFKIRPQSINNTTWNTFGAGTVGARTISTKLKIKGINSGLSVVISVTINEQFTR